MSDVPEQESSAPEPKKTRKVNPNGKKRGPKPKPVNKKIRVRVMDEDTDGPLPEIGNSLSYETPKRALTFDETCEYVEITVMEDPSEPREIPMNNGCNRPITFIRGHKCIIPKPYVDTMDEINSIKLLRHEPIDGTSFKEYYVPLMKFNYIIHRSGLTYADYKAQMDRFKTMPDPWDKARSNFPTGR